VGDALQGAAERTGAGILVAEHKADVLARLVGSVVVLDGGKVALHGDPATVLAHPRLPELGVAPPSAVRLARAVKSAGLELPAVAA
jgi:ABC-type glutathione transport system ATPase component